MKTGKIIRIISNLYTVSIDGENINCQARGKFRKDKITPLVGDLCEIDIEHHYIMKILPRTNYMLRPSIANVDVALIVTSMKKPDFSAHLLDKLISIVTLHQITPMICFTKIDLLTESEKSTWKQIRSYYKTIGYQTFTNEELSSIKETLKGKTVVVTGQTGAGKSSLLNKLCPELSLKTSPISESLNRGVHTTRHTEIYPIDGIFLADTPGFSALEFAGYQKEEIKQSFIEFSQYSCRFHDCNHIKEKDCKVKDAVESGDILKSRYESYQSFLSEV